MKTASLAIILCFAICSSPSRADVSDKIDFGGSVGRAWAYGSLHEPESSSGQPTYYSRGFTSSAFGDFWVDPRVAVGLDFRYTVFDGPAHARSATSDRRTDFLFMGAHVKWRPFGHKVSYKPWLHGGVGSVAGHDMIEFQEPIDATSAVNVIESNEKGIAYFLGGGLTVWSNGHGVDVGLSANYFLVSQDQWPFASSLGPSPPDVSFNSGNRQYFAVGLDVTLTRERASD